MNRWMGSFKFSMDVMSFFHPIHMPSLFPKSLESDKNELFHIIPVPHLFILKSSFSKNNLSAAHLPCLRPQETCQQSFPSI